MPSSNHLIETSPAKLVFLILVGGFIQAMRFASSAQNPSGSRAACSYIVAVALGGHVGVCGDLRADREDLAVGVMGVGHGRVPPFISWFGRIARGKRPMPLVRAHPGGSGRRNGDRQAT